MEAANTILGVLNAHRVSLGVEDKCVLVASLDLPFSVCDVQY